MKSNRRLSVFLIGATTGLVVILAVPSRKGAEPSAPSPVLDNRAPRHVAGVFASETGGGRLAEQLERSAQLEWGRDPFHWPVSAPDNSTVPPVPDRPQPRLTGVSICGEDRRAIIDHEIVREGDLLTSGYRVDKITNRAVTLLLDKVQLTLSFGEER